MNEERTRVALIGGIGTLILLCIVGIVWAIMAGPTPGGNQGDVVETNLKFVDDNDPAKGPGESKVVVRMFSDLQCPACRDAEAGLQYAMKTYGDKVRFVWNDYPLVSLHKNAMAAANAARCAEEQGKFWEFHDMVYDKQTDWSGLAAPVDQFTAYAKSLGMNTDSFSACVAVHRYQNKIQADQAEGDKNNVQATPTFFVNNIRRTGKMPTAEWDRLLKASLGS